MPNPIGPDLFRRLTAVDSPTLTPDGSRCAYVLDWIDAATSESRSRVYQVPLSADGAAAEPQPFTRGNADTRPSYSPDGARLAFLRPDAAAANPAAASRQLWVMPSHGGEPWQLTGLANGVREFAWSPDSTRLAAVADVCPEDPTGNAAPNAPQVRAVHRIRYRHDALGWRGDCHFHIFIVDANTGAAAQLTAGDWDDTAPVWSPDGRRIAFISGRSAERDVTANNEVYVVDVPANWAASASRPPDAAMPEAVLWSPGLTDAAAVAWAPDGARLVAVGRAGNGLMVLWQAYLYLLAPGRPPRQLTDDRIRPCLGYPDISPPLELRWAAGAGDAGPDADHCDGRILFLGDAAGATRLYSLPVPVGDGSGEPTALTGGGELITAIAMDQAARRIALVASGPATPGELHHVNLAAAEPAAPGELHHASLAAAGPADPGELHHVNLATGDGPAARHRLTAHNDPWLAEHPPAALEKFSVKRAGLNIECRLYHPPGFDPARQYPLVLEIHGGPNGAFYDAFTPLPQVLAGAGYLTLAVNPRGSSTYGEEFVNAVLGDWGGEDYLDLMAAVTAVCQRSYVDPARLGIHGYSYGGYMTAWAIGHTNRFRAAVAGAPCIDLWSMYGTSDIATGFGETQWAARPAGGAPPAVPMVNELAAGVDRLAHRLLQRSPITFAPNVATPVLLLHGETDARCPISQSEQYFQILKRLGKTVTLARFPGCGHTFLRTGPVALRQAYLERMLGWFRQWLG